MKGTILLLSCLRVAHAAFPFIPKPPPLLADDDGIILKREASTFEQLIDHKSPSIGTFQQRFWWNATYWKGPGSPIVLFSPGELAAEGYTGYLTDRAITGYIASQIGAAVVMIEHRNWGESLPYILQDTKNLQQHTLENAILDFVNFARHVNLPFDTNSSSNAPQAPWVWTGGSYSGALAAWIAKLSPGTFWAYHASSGPVEAVYDYWGYFRPIQNGMPQNCSKDFERMVEHIDNILVSGTDDEILSLKQKFGLEALTHHDDFAAALCSPLGMWQGIQLYSGYSDFYVMCDTIEGVQLGNSTVPNESGVGLPVALENYARWFNSTYLPGTCASYGYEEWQDPNSVGCFDSYNATSPVFTDWTAGNAVDRQWYWMTCNEPFFYWSTGAPKGHSSIVSRLVTAEYYQRQCSLFFPKQGCYTYASARGKTAEDFNAISDGWNLTDSDRLVWSNGEFDPWRSASVSSELRPGGPLQSRPDAPVYLIPGARHCNDLIMRNGDVNADMKAAITGEVSQIKTWVGEFYKPQK